MGESVRAVGLRELLSFLDNRTRACFRGSIVDDYLGQHEISLDDILPFTRFREDTYARNLIHRSPFYELIVLAWLPGQRAAIHDHAGQRCWTTVHNGELTFQNYEDRGVKEAPVPQGRPQVLGVGSMVYIDDGIGLHSIANEGRLPAITLHLYAAPVTHCRVYDEKGKVFRQVELQCFPPPPEAEWPPEHPLLPA